MRERLFSGAQVADTFGPARLMSFPSRPWGTLAFDARDFDSANLVAWYSAQRPYGLNTTPPVDGAVIAQNIEDLSGNGRHLANRSGTITYRTNGLGTGVPSIEFAGSSRAYTANFTHPGSWTCYAVVQCVTASGTRGLVDADAGGSSRQAQYIRFNTTLEAIAFVSTTPYTGTRAGTTTAKCVLVTKASQASNNVTAYYNNLAGTATATSGTLNALSMWLGINSANATAMPNCHYGEVILYTGAHNDTTRQSIQTALASYYGVTLS